MLWTASEGCDRRAMQAILVTSWWLVTYGRASIERVVGRLEWSGEKSTRLGLAVRWCLLGSKTTRQQDNENWA